VRDGERGPLTVEIVHDNKLAAATHVLLRTRAFNVTPGKVPPCLILGTYGDCCDSETPSRSAFWPCLVSKGVAFGLTPLLLLGYSTEKAKLRLLFHEVHCGKGREWFHHGTIPGSVEVRSQSTLLREFH
jgi:hypothetical protein